MANGSTLVEDQDAIERLKGGNDVSPDTQQQQRPTSSISIPVQPQQTSINWGAICRNPIVDYFISEPCETLTSPDRFTLTPKGQQVLVCLDVGGIAAYLAPEVLASIKSLGQAVGCCSDNRGESGPLGQGNPLDTMLGGLFCK